MAEPIELRVAAGALVNAQGSILIAQRPEGSHMAGGWEFPGGKIAADETPLAGLVRELREELGIEVQWARHLIRYSHDYPDRRVHLHVWLVPAWQGKPSGLEGQPLRWVAPGELLEQGLLAADEPIVELLTGVSAVNRDSWKELLGAVCG